MSMSTPSDSPHITSVDATFVANRPNYIAWSSILAGVAVAVAMSLLLTIFGAAIGLSVISPWSYSGASATTVGISAAIWFALVQIYAVGLGAYIASRMRPRSGDALLDEVRFRDGTNGLVVWAISLIVGAMLSAWIISAAAQTTSTLVSATAGAAGPAAERLVDTALRPQPQQQSEGAQQAPAQTAAAPRNELTDAQRAELTRIVGAALLQGEISASDRAYIEQVVARQTGVPPERAKERVSSAIDSAIRTAKEAADASRKAAAFSGFWAAAVMLLAGLAAWWGGSLGGSHRDESDAQFTSTNRI